LYLIDLYAFILDLLKPDYSFSFDVSQISTLLRSIINKGNQFNQDAKTGRKVQNLHHKIFYVLIKI